MLMGWLFFDGSHLSGLYRPFEKANSIKMSLPEPFEPTSMSICYSPSFGNEGSSTGSRVSIMNTLLRFIFALSIPAVFHLHPLNNSTIDSLTLLSTLASSFLLKFPLYLPAHPPPSSSPPLLPSSISHPSHNIPISLLYLLLYLPTHSHHPPPPDFFLFICVDRRLIKRKKETK